ncbi:MAG: hypothetical protein UV30_C0018G0003 [Candidatus Collierbacteria bacterium GW2011_GWF1_42_50]|nr:MAG: hypothetical protein UV30_C0018G0003 [Candidatus Collierbacteria bacterium GW2011_GWF1_42_50]
MKDCVMTLIFTKQGWMCFLLRRGMGGLSTTMMGEEDTRYSNTREM